MADYFVEIRRTVERLGKPVYVPLADVGQFTGFRSVYAIPAAARDWVIQRGSVSDMGKLPLYSDVLFIDVDQDDQVDAVATALQREGVGFEAYHTGRRGAHFHVLLEPMNGLDIPRAQRQWVESLNIQGWDATVYRPGSIIRLPGTFHEKSPGHTKQLRWTAAGRHLQLKQRPPLEVLREAALIPGERGPHEFWTSVLVPKGEPGRTFRLWHLARLAAECGVEYDEALAAVTAWAETYAEPPISNPREVRRVFDNGYRHG